MKKSSEKVIRWRKRFKRKLISAMGGKCQCCGYDRCDEALEFHHIDPVLKEFTFASIRANPKKLESIIPELEKCILVCSNCHKEIHSSIRIIPENYSKLDKTILISEYEIRKHIKQQKSIIPKIKIDRRKIFLTKDELSQLLEDTFDGNKSALARYLNVSETAVRKHLL